MKIYTKQGDKGQTSLYRGGRVPKTHPVILAGGAIDECNSCLGLSLSYFPGNADLKQLYHQIQAIQHVLFEYGTFLSLAWSKPDAEFDAHVVEKLEEWIDQWEDSLPTLKVFILPGGHPAAAALQQARAVCRRAETFITAIDAERALNSEALAFVNRLSDYLFVVARRINHSVGNGDIEREKNLFGAS